MYCIPEKKKSENEKEKDDSCNKTEKKYLFFLWPLGHQNLAYPFKAEELITTRTPSYPTAQLFVVFLNKNAAI